MRYRVIVAHPGQQHSFRTAAALKQGDILYQYCTTVYDSGNSFLMKILKRILPARELQRISGRKSALLDERDVTQFCEGAGLIEILLSRIDKKRHLYRKWHEWTAARFGRKVAHYAIAKQVDAVIMYDTTAKNCFEILQKKKPEIKRILDCSAASRLYMSRIYEKDAEICPAFAEKMMAERGHLTNENYRRWLQAELDATQYFFVPSDFVRKSLQFSGIENYRIYCCPYGANFQPALPVKKTMRDGILQVIYVGNVTEMKGIYYLLEAIKQMNGRAHLTAVGAYDNSQHLFDVYKPYSTFVGRVPHEIVADYLKEADVFVFPSLGEGLSLSCLEAMSCGLVCILSENSGANDAIVQGVNGFVVKPQSVEAIKEKLAFCLSHYDDLYDIGCRAYETALQYSWEHYGEKLMSAVNDIMKAEDA